MATQKEALAALDQVVAVVASPEALALTGDDLTKLCTKYHQVKPKIEEVLTWLALVPVYGSKVVAVIRFLMKLADLVCPLPAPATA